VCNGKSELPVAVERSLRPDYALSLYSLLLDRALAGAPPVSPTPAVSSAAAQPTE
jgi:hypothetical protein